MISINYRRHWFFIAAGKSKSPACILLLSSFATPRQNILKSEHFPHTKCQKNTPRSVICINREKKGQIQTVLNPSLQYFLVFFIYLKTLKPFVRSPISILHLGKHASSILSLKVSIMSNVRSLTLFFLRYPKCLPTCQLWKQSSSFSQIAPGVIMTSEQSQNAPMEAFRWERNTSEAYDDKKHSVSFVIKSTTWK